MVKRTIVKDRSAEYHSLDTGYNFEKANGLYST